jgi:hypothetical protein
MGNGLLCLQQQFFCCDYFLNPLRKNIAAAIAIIEIIITIAIDSSNSVLG